MERGFESFTPPPANEVADTLAEEQTEAAEPGASLDVREYTSAPEKVVNGIRVPGFAGKPRRATYVGVRGPNGQTIASKQVWEGLPLYSFRAGLIRRWGDNLKAKTDEKHRRDAQSRAEEEAAEQGVDWL